MFSPFFYALRPFAPYFVFVFVVFSTHLPDVRFLTAIFVFVFVFFFQICSAEFGALKDLLERRHSRRSVGS